jgi:hypothetical protein
VTFDFQFCVTNGNPKDRSDLFIIRKCCLINILCETYSDLCDNRIFCLRDNTQSLKTLSDLRRTCSVVLGCKRRQMFVPSSLRFFEFLAFS